MSETLAFALVVMLDVAAISATGLVATRFARGWILGAVTGLAVELVRILSAMAIVGQSFSGDSLAWLVNFRLFNIPILVGVGFMAGTAAARQPQLERLRCPSCSAQIDQNTALLKSKAVVSRLVKEPCPACNVQLTYDVGGLETIVSLERPDLVANRASAERRGQVALAGPALELVEVRKRYPGGAGLDGVSLSVPEGRILVLLGTSGSGKTTALKTINRLVEPDSGRVSVLGRDVAQWDPFALRRGIGYVIQEAGLLPHFSVEANVGLVPLLLGWPQERRHERSRELLQMVGLDPDLFAAKRPSQLSGGERQRVGIARALAADPPVLLMDEPFGALDPLTRRRIQDEFRELQGRLRKTVVLVTHDVPEALRLGDEVAVMDRGRIVQRGTSAEIRDAPQAGFVRDFVTAALV